MLVHIVFSGKKSTAAISALIASTKARVSMGVSVSVPVCAKVKGAMTSRMTALKTSLVLSVDMITTIAISGCTARERWPTYLRSHVRVKT